MIRVEVGDVEIGRWRTEGQSFEISECWEKYEGKKKLGVSLLY
jgi:hypothetical protein